MSGQLENERSVGLLGATGVGVGAIVGGGILALAGVAFATTGPAAIVAFALNGLIAFVTALSFAELATQFPESGGTYSFAKKVLSIEAAFMIGWIVWFASIVAAALYAFGFGAFLVLAIDTIWQAYGTSPDWLASRGTVTILACAATIIFSIGLLLKSTGGGPWLNIGKIVVFSILIAVGLWKIAGTPTTTLSQQLTPFFSGGAIGLVQAMGYTFIALQGFDLIAAIGGEIRNPRRNIPRAMFSSLTIALLIYMPLLLIVATVGTPAGTTVTELGAERPEAIVAVAAQNFLGGFGYWLVIVAGLLSMLSALQANLLAASRVALTMARDRTLPHWLETINPKRGTPRFAVPATAIIVLLVLVAVKDVAAVGAASSLIFLLTFALAHRITIMARRRAKPVHIPFRVPWFPLIPTLGGLACAALAVFQGISVPSAGLIACVWLVLGGLLYASFLARRARTVDAYSQAIDAELVRLRGRSPLVLVPVANPANVDAMVGVANALVPPDVGRVLLLTTMAAPASADVHDSSSVVNAQSVLRESLAAAFARNIRPEVLATIATNPWDEIVRVARTHRCESMLLGFSSLVAPNVRSHLEVIMADVASEVVILRAPPGWLLRNVRKVLVPIAGRGGHDVLRARLLGSIHRLGAREITLLRILPESATEQDYTQARFALARLARDEAPYGSNLVVIRSNSPADAIAEHAADSDLVVLGLRRKNRQSKAFGDVALSIVSKTTGAIIMISSRG